MAAKKLTVEVTVTLNVNATYYTSGDALMLTDARFDNTVQIDVLPRDVVEKIMLDVATAVRCHENEEQG